MRFLKVATYPDWPSFSKVSHSIINLQSIATHFRLAKNHGYPPDMQAAVKQNAMNRVQDLLSKYMLRRKKTDEIDGNPLIRLPEKTVHVSKLPFSPDEQDFYNVLFKSAKKTFDAYAKIGAGKIFFHL